MSSHNALLPMEYFVQEVMWDDSDETIIQLFPILHLLLLFLIAYWLCVVWFHTKKLHLQTAKLSHRPTVFVMFARKLWRKQIVCAICTIIYKKKKKKRYCVFSKIYCLRLKKHCITKHGACCSGSNMDRYWLNMP